MKSKLQVLDQSISTTTKDGIEYICITAKQWRHENPAEKGNVRDRANVHQLVCLANLESMSAHFIQQGLDQSEHIAEMSKLAIQKMRVLVKANTHLFSGDE